MTFATFRWLVRLLVVILVFGAFYALPVSRWVYGALWPGSQTQNAYAAFGQEEWTRPNPTPPNPWARADLALTDQSLAAQIADRPRIHRPGTLVTLEYKTIGVKGEELDHWQVRAIVPMLGDGAKVDAEVWTARVPDIESALEQQGGIVLRSSGTTGLPPEAILRFRVGESIEMDVPDGFSTTDFLDRATYSVRKQTISLVTGAVTTPAKLRVRLAEACAADIRVGRTTKLEFTPFSPLPIPIGFRESRWVQMIGCTPRAVSAGSVTNVQSVKVGVPKQQKAPLLRIERDGTVHFRQATLQAVSRPLRYRIETVCRFDAEQGRWQVLMQSQQSTEPVELPSPARKAGTTEAHVVARLPTVALYWLRWSEGLGSADVTDLDTHHGFGFVGGMLCEDIHLGPAPVGQVATCIPYARRAEARFVPDPLLACAPKGTH